MTTYGYQRFHSVMGRRQEGMYSRRHKRRHDIDGMVEPNDPMCPIDRYVSIAEWYELWPGRNPREFHSLGDERIFQAHID